MSTSEPNADRTVVADAYIDTVRAEIRTRSTEHPEARVALSALTSVLDRHRPLGIYGDCGHDHTGHEPHVVEAEDIGPTCALLYRVCRHCCTEVMHGGDNRRQREDCAVDEQPYECWPCRVWLDAGDALDIPRPNPQEVLT